MGSMGAEWGLNGADSDLLFLSGEEPFGGKN